MSQRSLELPSLTVIMPCLNEESSVAAAAGATLAAFDKYSIDGELIIVNDGSTDRTLEIATGLMKADRRIRVLSHEKPWGVGATFWHGVQEARNDYVMWIAGDNENDPEDALIYYYMSRDTDIIVPFIHNVEVRSVLRRVVSSLYRFIINVSFGMNLNYTNGAVIYNVAVLREINLQSVGFFYQAEILIQLIRAGYLYAETPHFLSRRRSGKTKALTLKSFFDVTKAYLHLMWDVHVRRVKGRRDAALNPKSATYRRMQAYTESA
ncbi:MAG: glycosyltransferase family 2 protein [Gammaproteobacteria bacterium]|nr:MAG: glycosyltransferase family 2 protein [Gammaproteobacteria bacterium]